jgi:hypothetical protein
MQAWRGFRTRGPCVRAATSTCATVTVITLTNCAFLMQPPLSIPFRNSWFLSKPTVHRPLHKQLAAACTTPVYNLPTIRFSIIFHFAPTGSVKWVRDAGACPPYASDGLAEDRLRTRPTFPNVAKLSKMKLPGAALSLFVLLWTDAVSLSTVPKGPFVHRQDHTSVNMEQQWHDTDRGKRNDWRKTRPCVICLHKTAHGTHWARTRAAARTFRSYPDKR